MGRRNRKMAVEALETQIYPLERHPEIPFLVRDPTQSGLWGLTFTTQAISRHPDWRLVRVDRCAYGRLEQKANKFLTNVDWDEQGTGGVGRGAQELGWNQARSNTSARQW